MGCRRKKGEPKDKFLARFMDEMKDDIPDEQERMKAAEKEFEKDDIEEETFSLDNVEIFEAGKWNGDAYSERDLDDMVKAFEETKGALKPYLKLGHAKNQTLLQKDGFPSAGWITGIKRQGKKLLARLENVPEKIYKLIVNKAYGRISSEIFWNLNFDGKKYRRALKAVALLGADTPEVHSLDDFINLYTTEKYDAELKCYHILKDDTMENEKILQDQIDGLSQKLNELTKEKEALLSENSELKDYAAKVEEEKKSSEIAAYLDKQIDEGRITPSQVEVFTALAMGEEVRTYTNKENQEVKASPFDLVKSVIESGSKVVDFEKGTVDGNTGEKTYSKNNKDEDATHEKIMKYAKENNVSYADAYDIISQEGVNE